MNITSYASVQIFLSKDKNNSSLSDTQSTIIYDNLSKADLKIRSLSDTDAKKLHLQALKVEEYYFGLILKSSDYANYYLLSTQFLIAIPALAVCSVYLLNNINSSTTELNSRIFINSSKYNMH